MVKPRHNPRGRAAEPSSASAGIGRRPPGRRARGCLMTVAAVIVGAAVVTSYWVVVTRTFFCHCDDQHPEKTAQQQSQQDFRIIKSSSSPSPLKITELIGIVAQLDEKVRDIKARPGVYMEIDSDGQEAIKELQDATRQLLKARYGPNEPYRVRCDLIFQKSHPTYNKTGENTDTIVIDLAASRLMPVSVYKFLEISRHWDRSKGSFHRKASHVSQVRHRMVGKE